MSRTKKILVATHKEYPFPKDPLYIPIHVGKTLSDKQINILSDDSGDNISSKNQSFCELTALYWAWKNDFFKDCDVCGLVHYRRYFYGSGRFLSKSILTEEEIGSLMREYDVLLPRKRNYVIETVYTHYANAHYQEDMDAAREVVALLAPEFVYAFDEVMARRKLHLYNMFVMKTDLFAQYCEWLFSILFELERRLDISVYDDNQKRVFGYIGERLFNVWLRQKKPKCKELKVVNLEGENKILKGMRMVHRKFNR
jgi:hypothetical protein